MASLNDLIFKIVIRSGKLYSSEELLLIMLCLPSPLIGRHKLRTSQFITQLHLIVKQEGRKNKAVLKHPRLLTIFFLLIFCTSFFLLINWVALLPLSFEKENILGKSKGDRISTTELSNTPLTKLYFCTLPAELPEINFLQT